MDRPERELRKAAVVVAASSMVGTTCAFFLLYRWVRHTFKRRIYVTHEHLPRWSWFMLAPALLFLLAQHIVTAVAGFTDILRGSPLAFYGPNENLELPALLTQQLFLLFELVAVRVAFWEILFARRRKAFKAIRHAAWLVVGFDLLLGIGLVVTLSMSAFLTSYGLCWEYYCGNATQLAIIVIRNFTLSAGFPAVVLAAIISLLVSYYFLAKWTPPTPGTHLSSPLAHGVLRTVGPGLVAQFLCLCIAIGVSYGDHDNYWHAYYTSIPYSISQVVLIGLLIRVLKRTPVFADPDSFVDRNSNPLVAPNTRSSLRGMTPERYSATSADSPTGGPRFPPGLEPAIAPYAVEVGLEDAEYELDEGGVGPTYQVYRGNEKTALDTIAEDECEGEDCATDGRRSAGLGSTPEQGRGRR